MEYSNQAKHDFISEVRQKFSNKEYESVVALTDKVLLSDKNNYHALSFRAMSLESLEYYLDSIDDYNRILSLFPDDGNIFGLCGLCYKSIGELGKAKAYL